MNKRILSVLIAIFILAWAFTLTVYATSGLETPGADVVDPNPAPVPDTPVDPGVTDPTTAPETPVDPGVTDPTTAPETPVDPGYTDPTTAPEEEIPVEPTTDTSGYIEDPNNEDFYYYDEEQMANSIENSAGSVKDSTDLYDTSDINKAELKETKWDNIVLDTKKSNADAMDFSAIKQNKESDDDSKWIIYAGFSLIGLSLIGIMYFIIATATYKKKLKKLNRRQVQHNSHRARDDYGDYSDYPTQSDYNRRYSSKKRYASDGMGYAERKRLTKADTAEINLPTKHRARH